MRMMAARYLQSGRGLTSFGKRFLNFVSRDSLLPPTTWRAVHVSVYDKNPEDQTTATVVPDTVIQPQSTEYWSPHPQTGVFGPSTEQSPLASGEGSSSSATAPEDSVLEQKAFYRPLEDLEKPPPQP